MNNNDQLAQDRSSYRDVLHLEINLRQLSRKMCKCDQPCERKSAIMADLRRASMVSYLGRKIILCIDDDHGMLGYQRGCWKDADTTCSLLTLHHRVYRLRQPL
jgi:hypothetical protein